MKQTCNINPVYFHNIAVSSKYSHIKDVSMMETVNAKYAEIGRRMRAIPQDLPGTSYEWEELVQRLCASDDDGLRDIGVRELKILLLR